MRYGRGLEVAVTTGKDSAGTTLPNQSAGGLLGAATVGTTTATLAADIGWSDLTAVFSALDPAYTITPSWVMNSSTRSFLIGLKDGFGRPYFQNNPGDSAPFQSIMGFPIVLDQAMPSMGASKTPILFGDLEKSYLLRTDGAASILRLNERFADTLEVGFFLWTRIGGLSLAAGVQPLVSLKQAAS
jgi:HK97 family phage major capsid protein